MTGRHKETNKENETDARHDGNSRITNEGATLESLSLLCTVRKLENPFSIHLVVTPRVPNLSTDYRSFPVVVSESIVDYV